MIFLRPFLPTIFRKLPLEITVAITIGKMGLLVFLPRAIQLGLKASHIGTRANKIKGVLEDMRSRSGIRVDGSINY